MDTSDNQDYFILDDKIVYYIDKFDVNKHLTYNVLTKELIKKQEKFLQYRSVIKLNETVNKKYNPYTINVLCKPIKKSKGIFIFKYNEDGFYREGSLRVCPVPAAAA